MNMADDDTCMDCGALVQVLARVNQVACYQREVVVKTMSVSLMIGRL